MTAPRIAFLGKVLLAGAVLASPLLLTAQGNDPSPGSASTATQPNSCWKSNTIDGFLSFSYTYNSNDPLSARQNQFRVFDFSDNSPELDVAHQCRK
jgi:hypothetical protein